MKQFDMRTDNLYSRFVRLAMCQAVIFACANLVVAQQTNSPPVAEAADEIEIELAPPTRTAALPAAEATPRSVLKRELDLNAPPDTANLQELITNLARAHMPHDFEDKRHWGMTDDRWDGLKFERDGIRIETRRRKKEVNHGHWKMYRAELANPNEEFSIRVKNLHRREDGLIGFDVIFLAKINVHGRSSEWVKGVQLYSISADGIADVKLRVSCLLGTNLDFSRLPPDLVFSPKVTDADLTLVDFQLIRISKAGGEVAQQLGNATEKILREKIDEKEAKIVRKANAAIEKNRDKFRLSAADFLQSQWAEWADKLLPAETVQQLKQSSKEKPKG